MKRLAVLKKFFRIHKRKIKYLAAALFLGFAVIAWLAYIASIHAAQIFNREMARQHLLDGSVTVERLVASPLGHVSFENLEWKGTYDNNRVIIPSGSFKVRPLDIVFKRISTRTIENLELNDADIELTFTPRMHIRGFKAAERLEKPPEKKGEKKKRNFDIKLKNLDVALKLNHCHVTIHFKQRLHKFTDVNADIHYNSKDKLDIDFSTGELAGTLEGHGIDLQGSVDLKPKVSTCNLSLGIRGLNPSSLGTGMNIHERVSAAAAVTGPISEPVFVGELFMKNLNLPGLKFTNVKGNFKYEDGYIAAKNVKADIFGGTCDAYGGFNIDTKAYEVNVLGHDLHSEDAANVSFFRTLVQLDLHMLCDGDNRSTLTYGSFYSGKGMYAIVKFDSIKGTFSNQYKKLKFSDVEIQSESGDIVAPQFELVDGKLHLGNLYYVSPDGRRTRISFFG